ncbi:MAG: hypothetical protein RIG61_08400 [Deltaproteobacteria bacterium]
MRLVKSNLTLTGCFLTLALSLVFCVGYTAQVSAQEDSSADSKEKFDNGGAEAIVEDTEWGDVSVELKGVKRASGDTVTVKFKYTNNGSEEIDISRAGQYSHDDVIEHVYYVDASNNKKYLIVKDSEGKPLGTKLKYFVLAPGESKSAWAKFPAPPEGVDKITVYLPGAPPFEDVAIAQ